MARWSASSARSDRRPSRRSSEVRPARVRGRGGGGSTSRGSRRDRHRMGRPLGSIRAFDFDPALARSRSVRRSRPPGSVTIRASSLSSSRPCDGTRPNSTHLPGVSRNSPRRPALSAAASACQGRRREGGVPSPGAGRRAPASNAPESERALTSFRRAKRTRGGEKSASRKVRTPKGRAVGNAHPAKAAGKCHRNIRPMARPHVSRVQAKVKRCGKSAPASW